MFEIFELVAKETSRNKKIEILRSHKTDVLLNILKGTFDDVIVWKLPGGKVPYEPADPASIPSTLTKQIHKLVYFIDTPKYKDMLQLKREKMFIDMLESIHPKEAEVLVKMINKTSPAKGVTKALVQEAFPDLIKK